MVYNAPLPPIGYGSVKSPKHERVKYWGKDPVFGEGQSWSIFSRIRKFSVSSSTKSWTFFFLRLSWPWTELFAAIFYHWCGVRIHPLKVCQQWVNIFLWYCRNIKEWQLGPTKYNSIYIIIQKKTVHYEKNKMNMEKIMAFCLIKSYVNILQQ